jgi:hypothetical protein
MSEIAARFDLLTHALDALGPVDDPSNLAGRFHDAIARLDPALATDADVAALRDLVRNAVADGTLTEADATAFAGAVEALNARDAAALEASLEDLAAGVGEGDGAKKKSWFAALAEALGRMLDARVEEIETASAAVGDEAKPSDLIKLNEVLSRFGFQSGMAKTAMDAGGQALNTLARPA